MTNAPNDLLWLRIQLGQITGLSGNDIGIVGDGAHQHTGGYHEGKDVLRAIGRYNPAAAVGSSTQDYSVRTARDRRGVTNSASALDLGADWVRGGRPAWLRYNNLLVAALHANDPQLSAIRGINYSPDGHRTLRTDRELGWSVIASGDTVTTHTHHEFYRDTETRRAACLQRLTQLAVRAINGQPPAPQPTPVYTTGDKMLTLLQIQGQPAVYVSDAIQCRWVQSEAELAQLQNYGNSHWHNMYNGGQIVEVSAQDFRALAGVLVGPDPTAPPAPPAT